ncbi:transglutaminase family protein [Oscillatoria sp. FACHB-1407]|nr:transglutaminase family protein [Oscillatoria sp. FACHB-1407]
MLPQEVDGNACLQPSPIIDWQHPHILKLAQELSSKYSSSEAIAQACFEWVRDQIYHSVDYQMNPVTCRASDVLKYKTGYCYAKSHLLAALLRANGIPAGFCYQRLSIDGEGAPYCLHGLNAVYLPKTGWYRIDARGNRSDINAQFTPPIEQLAYSARLPGEVDSQTIWTEPLPLVVSALQAHTQWDEMLGYLPDLLLDL